jgi:hypothetical protein
LRASINARAIPATLFFYCAVPWCAIISSEK